MDNASINQFVGQQFQELNGNVNEIIEKYSIQDDDELFWVKVGQAVKIEIPEFYKQQQDELRQLRKWNEEMSNLDDKVLLNHLNEQFRQYKISNNKEEQIRAENKWHGTFSELYKRFNHDEENMDQYMFFMSAGFDD